MMLALILTVILEAIERQVAKYNTLNPERSISYTCGKAVSSTDNTFEIRDLLRLALQRMSKPFNLGNEKRNGNNNGRTCDSS